MYNIIVMFQGFLLLALFIAASVIDIRKREIPDSINVLIALAGFLTFSFANLAGILIALPFLVTAVLCKGRLGGGDIKFMAAAGFVLGFEFAVIASIIGLTASLIYCGIVYIFRRKSERERNMAFPLAPFLSTGCMAAYIISQIGGLIII